MLRREKQEKTGSDLKKDGLMKNEFGKFVSKKRFGAVKTRSFMKWFRVRLAESLHERDSSAVGRFPFGGKVGEEKKEKKAEDMEMHTLGVEVGGMQLEEEIEEPVETCFEGFTCVYAADLQEEEKNLEGMQESLVATEYSVVDQKNMSNDVLVLGLRPVRPHGGPTVEIMPIGGCAASRREMC